MSDPVAATDKVASTDAISPGARASLERLAYTVDEALQIIPIGRTSLYEMIADGSLHTIKVRGRRLIPRASLEGLALGGDADGIAS